MTDSAALTDEVRDLLTHTAVATVSAMLRKHGYVDVFIDGVSALKKDAVMIGTARTLRFVPFRPDLSDAHGGGYHAQKRIIDTLNPGEVLVMDARGSLGSGTLGDVMALRAQVIGAAGVVTDGAVRDYEAVAALDLPVFAGGAHPSQFGRSHVPWETDVTISCGGAAVQPGDIIFGDSDGVIVIPPHLVATVAAEAVEQDRQDAWVAERVAEGHAIDGLFPMNAKWKARYEAERDRTN